ncbi:restriction endonuclease subunit S [Mediterranea massiliensis]|uniref:restriction endonuclease subunit S n=1 Tax=Mediterranea massiliensis TaxID=1841865 RepID=UPI0009347E59|nr:restriction endonuclease subunit S [Mediterranea massiliensis]
MEEWKEFKLSDLTIMKNGKKRPSCIGQYPVYGGNGIMDYADVFNAENTIVVGRVGAYCGNVYYCSKKCWVSDNAIAVFANDLVDIKYLFYLMSSLDLHHQHIGGAQPLMTQDIIGGFKVFIPSLNIQEKIASFLSSLDDKIELNRRINENLEQQAQALFKSWFVDFEPFKDGKFVNSELGMIPEGWRVGTLEEIGQIIGGGTPSKANSSFYCENGIPWITPKDLSINKSKYISRGENDITEIGYRNSSAKKIPAGSVLFSSRAPIGYIAIANNEVTTNQGFKSVIPTKAGTCFIYLFLQLYKKYIESLATGSTFKEASGALMKSLKLKIPPQSIFENFEFMLNPLFSQQCVLESEIDHLSKLRDTLLPRLMSGELAITDVDDRSIFQ